MVILKISFVVHHIVIMRSSGQENNHCIVIQWMHKVCVKHYDTHHNTATVLIWFSIVFVIVDTVWVIVLQLLFCVTLSAFYSVLLFRALGLGYGSVH